MHSMKRQCRLARAACLIVLAIACGLCAATLAPLRLHADSPARSTTRLARVLEGGAPRSLDDLKEIQKRIRQLTDRILPATVAIQVGRANGSGVIIDPDGHVLTAAHVAGVPGRQARIHLPDGQTVSGITLGLNQELDAGLVRITDSGRWPHARLGKSNDIKAGQWCLATGHPGGYDLKRPPVLRWGRVLRVEDEAILTDCALVGGDSGGPLFDLQGNVIGVHSRIGKPLTVNVHVPVDRYTQSWDRLVKGDMWGLLATEELPAEAAPSDAGAVVSNAAWLGVFSETRTNSGAAIITRVAPNSPAARAALQPGDIVLRVGDVAIDSFEALQAEIRSRQPGERVVIHVRRNDAVMPLNVQLGGSLRVPQP
jgi:serine protease Do